MKDEIALIRNYFLSRPVVKAYLFGSTVRGNNAANSDIDILIELSDEADLYDFIAMKQELEALLNKSVDLVSARGLSPHIRPFIEKDKQLIYERKAG